MKKPLAALILLLILVVRVSAQAPVALPLSVSVPENTETNILLDGTNASDSPLSYSVALPLHGNIYIYYFGKTTTGLQIFYDTATNYVGSDSFSYTVSDSSGTSPAATVNINVTEVSLAPVPVEDAYAVKAGKALGVSSAAGLLANDFDPNGLLFAASLGVGPTNGQVTLNPDGSFIYTPNSGFMGYDQFTYFDNNSNLTSGPATVTLGVGNEAWDDQFSPSDFGAGVYVISVATNGDVYAGGAVHGGIARWDGRVWHPLGNRLVNGVNGSVNALAWMNGSLYVGGQFASAGGRPVSGLARWNGQTWATVPGLAPPQVQALAASGNLLYVGGQFTAAGNLLTTNIAAWDGTNWSNLGDGINGVVYALAADTNGDVYAAGSFTKAGVVTAKGVALWNGAGWSSLGNGFSGSVDALLLQGGALFAAGNFTNAQIHATNVACWDGGSWSALGAGLPGGPIQSLMFTNGILYAGQSFEYGTASSGKVFEWDGTNWTALPQNLALGATVQALAMRGDLLLAGGAFKTAGLAVVDDIAAWDGTNWNAVNNAIEGEQVNCVTPEGSDVYLGGVFTSAAGTQATNIVRWDGDHWNSLGNGASNGVNGQVNAIAAGPSGGIYAAGEFTEAGGQSVNHIAFWDGANWNPVGTGVTNGVSGTVNALTFDDAGNLIVGGSFTEAGGLTATNIAAWNGQEWTALGGGIQGRVLALAMCGTQLYAGGAFYPIGEGTANVERWDGASWRPAGEATSIFNTSTAVTALAARGPTLFAGLTGYTLPAVARMDGTNWTPIATNWTEVEASINSLQVIGNDLYAGGFFTSIGAAGGSSIARWDGTNWNAVGTGVEGQSPTVYSLAWQGNELLVGGGFSIAGAKPSTLFGRWQLNEAPPMVQITNPAAGSTFTVGANIDLGVAVSDTNSSIVQVAYYAGPMLIGVSSTSPYSLTWTNVFTGDYIVYAYATDATGETSASAPLQIVVAPPSNDIPPTVSIATPTNGAVFTTGQAIPITATASDSDGLIRQVAFYQDNVLIGIATNAPYTGFWSNSVDGSHELTAVAMDNFGAANAATVDVILDYPPTVFIDEPLAGTSFASPAYVYLEANANVDVGSIVRVDFYTNGAFFVSASINQSPEYGYRWTNPPFGNYSVTALATDDSGFTTMSLPVQFAVIVSNVPDVSITSPTPGTIYAAPTNIVVSVSVSDTNPIQSVQLYSHTALLGTITNPPYTFVLRNLAATTYCMQARATNELGEGATSPDVCVTVTNDPARTPLYNIVDIGAILGPESFAYGINNYGVIVGGSSTTNTDSLPFLYTNGTVITPPIIYTFGLGGDGNANAVNEAGVAVGAETDSGTGHPHAIRFQGTNIINLGTLGGIESRAYGINDSGQIVGYAFDTNEAQRAFLYANGKMTNLDSFGGIDSVATAVNSSGQIAGWWQLPSYAQLGFIHNLDGSNQILGSSNSSSVYEPLAMNDAAQTAGGFGTLGSWTHAFLALQGFTVDLGTLGDLNSVARGINNRGEVVGWSGNDLSHERAFLWQNDVMYDLNALIPTNSGWVLQQANAINDQGQIVGYGSFSNQYQRAFLLTVATNSPVTPEDSQLLSYSDGNFSLNLPVPLGMPSVVETSSNLVDWIPIATNYDRNGLVNFSDPQAGRAATRFYRAVQFMAPGSQ